MNTTPTKPKKPTMQDEADRLFALQMSLSPKTKHTDRAVIAAFLAFLVIFGVLLFVLPQKDFSEQENRDLQKFPALSSPSSGSFAERLGEGKFLDRYFSGKFSEEFSDFCADQFPARDFFIGVKSTAELLLGKGENNGVLLGRNGYLITKMEDSGEKYVNTNAKAVKAFAERMQAENVPVTLAAAGRTADIMTGCYPALYDTTLPAQPWSLLNSAMAETGENLTYLDLRPTLTAHAEAGEQVMYRTDHHWTTYGAYLAYCDILRSWDMEPMPLDFFTRETASDAFYGTAWRTAGIKWVKPDAIEFFRYPGDEDYTLTVVGKDATFAGFYDRSYLEVTDKYSAVLSGNQAYETVKKNDSAPRETLLLIKDSFGHSLAPFLAYHFDLEIVDLRYYKQPVVTLAKETGCDRALILYNMASLVETSNLSLLGME